MKFSLPLNRHNLYRMMRNQWKVARKRTIWQPNCLETLDKYNIKYVDANEYASPRKFTKFE